MKRRKKILSLILAFSMTFSCMSNVSLAAVNEVTEVSHEVTNNGDSRASHEATKPADGITEGQPFAAGTGGSDNFRIPCLVALDDGTIVAACDARWTWIYDAGGIDTIVSRSTDNGATWNYTFANYMGDNGNVHNNKSTCFIDPAMATDGEKIYMIADLYPAGYAINSAAHTATPGVSLDEYGNLLLSADGRSTYAYHLEQIEGGTVEDYYQIVANESGQIVAGYVIDAYFNIKSTSESGGTVDTNMFFENSPFEFFPTDYLYLTTSEDGGATWSVPSIINVRKPEEQSLLVGPGTGIVTSTGRIIFTVYDFTYADGHSATIYSDDGGVTWTRGESVANQTSEATLTEADGRLYMFTRHGGYYVSEDWGETWSDVKQPGISYCTSVQLNCMTYSKKIDGKTAIILSVPTSGRNNGKIFVALVQEDGPLEWKYEYAVNQGVYAYSSIAELNDGSIGLLYESASAAITYTNISLRDIIGEDAQVAALSCKDAAGVPVTSVNMKPGQEVTLEVSGASGLKVEANSDNESVEAALTGTTLTISSDEEIEELEEAEITVTDGIDTVVVKVKVLAAEDYEMVNLVSGETVTYVDETGNYTDTDLSKVDTSVATVTLTSRDKDIQAGLESNTSGTSGADFAEGTVEVRDCLYTFTKSEDNQYVISAKTADGKTVYLTARGQKGNYPSMESDTPITTTVAKITDADADNEFSLTAEGVLYFWNSASKGLFYDRNSAGSVSKGNCWFELYRPAETQEEEASAADSVIPGYVKLTELTDIKDGGKYLIAHEGFDGAYYLLHPSASISDKYAHVAKVLPETVSEKKVVTDIVITAVAEGMTYVTVGDTAYYISVEKEEIESNVKKVTLAKGESMGVVEEVAQPEGDVISVVQNTDAAPYAPVSEITDGKYLIGNSNHIVTNEASSSTNPIGLLPKVTNFLKDNVTEKMWTVTAVEGGHTIQDANGKYLTINGSNVTLSENAQVLVFKSQGENLYSVGVTEGNTTNSLNNYGGTNTNIAAWSGLDDNSKWYFYQSTGNVITGTNCGTVEVVVGTTTYEITVAHDCEWEVTTAPTCTSKGEETGTCSMCKETFTREIAPLHHTYGEWVIDKEATCTTTGLKSRTCTSCQKATEEKVVPLTGEHTYGKWTTITESTCNAKGTEERTCTVENCTAKEQRAIAKKAHTLSEWTVTKEATLATKGEISRNCTVEGCDYTETRIVVGKAEKPADGITKDQPFAEGTGGSNKFRIPCIVTLDDGTIVAACDARWTTYADGGGLDTIVSRSKDNGKTWQYTFANYMGDNGNTHNSSSTAFIDPSIATDGETVYMIADLFPAGYALNGATAQPKAGENGLDKNGNLRLSANNRATYEYYLEKIEDGSTNEYYEIKDLNGKVVEGYTIDAYFNIKGDGIETNLFMQDSPYQAYPTDYLYLTSSKDGGATWSVPSLINVKRESEQTLLVGPGTGIVTSTGRIVFTVYEFTGGDRNSAAIYSDDGGVTWKRGASVSSQSSEATVVEADGKLFMFTRHGGYYISEDWGETWSTRKEVGTAYATDTMINAITYSKKIDGKTAIILSAPAGSSRRTDGKLFVGLVQDDGTLNWAYEYEINKGKFAYSSITELKDGSIGILYEDDDASILYKNVPITDIAGIWLEDEDGKRITKTELKAGESATFTLCGTPDNALEIVSDNEAVTATWNEADATVTISADAAAVGLTEAVVTIADGSGSVIVVNVIVTGAEVSAYEIVDLKVGETAEFRDETGDYSNTDVSSVADIAEIIMVGENTGITETRAQLATGAGNFNGGLVNISEVLYTFDNVTKTEGSTTFTCTPTATTANGATVYLNNSVSAAAPNQTSAATMTFALQNDGTYTIRAGGNQYLYFHYNNAGQLYFNRNSSAAAGFCYFELYTASENAPADSPIPGYVKVTSLDAITEDGKYLIVKEGIVNNESVGHYLLYPYSGGSNFNHVAKATGEIPGSASTEISIKAIAAGSKSIQIGNTTYFINVNDKVENITIGMHEKFFLETEGTPTVGEQSVITMEKNGSTTAPYKPVSTIANGKYLMGNASYVIINEAVEGTPAGLALKSVKFESEELADDFWTVTSVEGGYTIQDENGKYININGENVNLTDTAQTLQIKDEGENKFAVGISSGYFNNWGGSSTKVAAYGSIDANSRWYFYQPAAGYWITASAEGTVTVVVDDVTYHIEVIECQHKNMKLDGVVAANCIKEGNTGVVKCADCGATIAMGTVIPKTDHIYSAWEVTTEPNCVNDGVKTRTCTTDGCDAEETKVVPAIGDDGHTMNEGTVIKEATCVEAGEKIVACTNQGCTYSTTVVIDKLTTHTPGTEWSKDETNHWHVCTVEGCNAKVDEAAHTWNEGIVTQEPTATEDGVKTYTCTVCEQTKTESVPAIGEEPCQHQFGEWTVSKAATCKEAGEETRSCSVCGETETREIAKLTTHSYGEWTVSKAATCAEAGKETRSCSVCGETEEREIDKLTTHTPGTEWSKNETNHWHVCTVEGCNAKVDEAAHTWNEGIVTQEPTATEDGVKTYTCTVCEQTKTETVPATGEEKPCEHQFGEWTVSKAATCKEAGEETRICSVCGEKETRETAKLTTHQFGEWTETKATCTTAGSKVRVCVCGAKEEVAVPATGHKMDAGTITTPATCVKEGVKTFKCMNAGCTYSKTEVIEKPTTHTPGTEWTKDETKHWHECTVEGCGAKVDEAAHTWDEGKVIKKPTITKKGVKTYTCTVCESKKTEEIKALGTPKKGTTFVVNGATYKITKSGLTGGTVAFVKTKSTARSITIPKTVKSKGITYKVTEIAKNALKGNKKVTKVTIGSNVAKIGANAFDKCTKLKSFTIKTTKLTSKNIAKNAFKGVNKTAKMKVPKAKVNAYKKLFKSKGLSSKVRITK